MFTSAFGGTHSLANSTGRYQSWGGYPKVKGQRVISIHWQDDVPDLAGVKGPVLPYAFGRSYGDSCLNEGGTLIDAKPLNRYLAFDQASGLLRCEAGVQFKDILDYIVPRGWFLPITPGTKYISVGGAIANDVHGKNHHVAGTFGSHLTQFELLRSDGTRLVCSPTQNAEMFRATVGGLGLTGLVLWAEFRLRPIPGPFIQQEKVRFRDVDEFFDLSEDSDKHYEYSVSWVDCVTGGARLGRGIMTRGNHSWKRTVPGKNAVPKTLLAAPFDLPSFALNIHTARAFNEVYYRALLTKTQRKTVPYDPFFYPLDFIAQWNKLYGADGFLQYQFVVPFAQDRHAIKHILRQISTSGVVSFLAVLKVFGDVPSPGMLSFPRPGVTLALDFPYRGARTLRLLDRLDAVVRECGGAVYPAKDARMSPEMFEVSFPNWREFARYIDPKFSSSFWRRVTCSPAPR
jgi:FAD/FMN-containing dehydrogenase